MGIAEAKLASLAVTAVRWLVEERRKIAVLVNDVLQAIGPDKAVMYAKSLLGWTSLFSALALAPSRG